MLKALQVRAQENISYRKKSSNSVKFDRSKTADIKFLQNFILTQTLPKPFGFQVKHF